MFKSIVWASDGSGLAQKALPLVKELARADGAKITIVHVVERVEGGGAVGLPRRADEAQVQARSAGAGRGARAGRLLCLARDPRRRRRPPGPRDRDRRPRRGRRPDRGRQPRPHRDRRAALGERDQSSAAHLAVPGPGRASRIPAERDRKPGDRCGRPARSISTAICCLASTTARATSTMPWRWPGRRRPTGLVRSAPRRTSGPTMPSSWTELPARRAASDRGAGNRRLRRRGSWPAARSPPPGSAISTTRSLAR